MAQSTEPTDIPMPLMDIEAATEIMAQGTAHMEWQRQELDRRARRIEHLTRCVDSKTVEIARLKHQLAILRRHP